MSASGARAAASCCMSAHEWIVPDWPAPPRVRALITTRSGGVSRGAYAGLNLGQRCGDDLDDVACNRARLRQWLPAEPLWLRQVHGTKVVEADAVETGAVGTNAGETGAVGTNAVQTGVVGTNAVQTRAIGTNVVEAGAAGTGATGAGGDQCDPEADAALARRPGTVCAVLTADCLPLLLCDEAGTVVAAVHAGWRGLCSGVIEQTLCAMDRPPRALLAYLGPAIGPEAYEVGAEVRAAFAAADRLAGRGGESESELAFAPAGPGKFRADLYALARGRLARGGVTKIHGGGHCTYTERERFFSYRRDGATGRMASLIWLEP